MRPSVGWLCVVLGSVAVSGNAWASGSMPMSGPAPGEARVTRIFYLEAMESSAAMTRLRTEGMARIATVSEPRAVVVSDSAAKVDAAEKALRAGDSGLRAVDPHGPLRFDSERPEQSRRITVLEGRIQDAQVLLRSIYGAGENEPDPAGKAVTVWATSPVLDAIESTLRELGMAPESLVD